jgi:hypothetical protein
LRALPQDLDEDILNRLFQGFAYRRIGNEFSISIATVNRVAADAGKKIPDFDSLRQLSVLMRKTGLSIFDATRACQLIETLNTWGISIDELCDYVKLNEELLSKRTLNEDFLFYALALMRLVEESGRTYQEVVEDLEKKRRETAEAEEKKVALEKESLGLKTELEDTKRNLAEINLQIAKATTARKGLTEIGVGKLAQLVRFIKDFESMGFDVGQLKRLAVWRRELERLGIDPNELGDFVAEKGPLEAQNDNLRLDNERIKGQINTQTILRMTLLAGNSVLQAVDQILRTKSFTMFCKSCRHPMPAALPTQESLNNLTSTRQVWSLRCSNCGTQQFFSPWEIALHIAWVILPQT